MDPILSHLDPDARPGQGGPLEVLALAMRAEFLHAPPPSPALLAKLSATAAATARVSDLVSGPASEEIEPLAGVPAGRRAPRAWRPGRPALAARIALAALSVPLLLTGLAFAGVTLPAPARDAIERIGVTLPNQPDDAGADAAGPGPGGESAGDRFANGPTMPGEKGKGKGLKDSDGRPGNSVGPAATGQSNGVAKGPNPTPGEPRGEGSGAPPAHSNAGGKKN